MLGQVLNNRFWGFSLCLGIALIVVTVAAIVDQAIQLVRWAF